MNLEVNSGFAPQGYRKYQQMGGVIDERDYMSALAEAKNLRVVDRARLAQAENIARVAGIQLTGSKTNPDPRVKLYAVLRETSGLTDQPLFAEVLKMLGDTESLKKLISAHPNIFGEGK